jgi:PKD repeat protein
MKITKSVILVVVIISFSCSKQQEIQPQDIEASEAIMFSIENNRSGFETNTSISFHNHSNEISDVQWSFGDGTTTTGLNPTHSYNAPGKYIVTLNAVNNQGTASLHSEEVFVRTQGSQLDILFISYQDSSLNYVDLRSNTVSKIYDVPYNPAGVLALDEANKKVYYYDYSQNMVIENELAVNNPQPLIQDLPGVSDMEFDQISNKLFISLSYDNKIIKYDPSSKSINTSYGSPNLNVKDMDLKNGYLYTITQTQGYESVFKVDINGGSINRLIDYDAGGYGYGLAYDDLNDKIYFNNVEEAALMRSDADGSNIEKVVDLDRYGTVAFTGLCLVGLKVVETRNQLMWSAWEDGTLHTLDLETSQEKIIKVEGLDGKFVPFENSKFLAE